MGSEFSQSAMPGHGRGPQKSALAWAADCGRGGHQNISELRDEARAVFGIIQARFGRTVRNIEYAKTSSD
jgi:hypothetical protein